MFDPTVFENIKVAIENYVYDLDNISGEVDITNRMDRLELSVMSREFRLQFSLATYKEITAEIVLQASLKDLADEILEVPGESPGCSLFVRYMLKVEDIENECNQIDAIISKIWDPVLPPIQTLRFDYGKDDHLYHNTIELSFPHKINEEQMKDIPEFIDHVLKTLGELQYG
ncbi:hypothetical protein ACFFHM_07400 [Halalkalibacter kiskunsagensis]|uniref:Uncharacterized protein n=1 Tax=Halalkalibacter kiskunsagensis TaxID=1548599 RepID=A0ABV6KAL2_9BACI